MRHALLTVNFEERQPAAGSNLVTTGVDYARGAAAVPDCLRGKKQTGGKGGSCIAQQKVIAPDLQLRRQDREFLGAMRT